MRAIPEAEQDAAAERSAWPVYQIYGLTLASDFAFKNRLVRASGTPQLTFTCVSEPSSFDDRRHGELVYESPYRVDGGKSNYSLYRVAHGHVLRFADVAEFFVTSDRIVCRLLDPGCRHVVEILLLGSVLSFWLELREIPVLHAAVVVIGSGAVAFLADNKGGKSSLAASLMRRGCELLSDDILPVRFSDDRCFAEPGYPQMRLWPDQAGHFLGRYEHLERVDPPLTKRRVPVGADGLGMFCERPKPLSCLYIPSRRSTEEGCEVEIQPVPMAEALIELVRHSFVPHSVQALGLQPQRLSRLSRILGQVPVRRLLYPSGMEYLPGTCNAVLDDLEGVSV